MITVRSNDGTQIAFWRSGQGPALLLVHGATASHATTWKLVLSQLEQHFTVYAMDRRGRGGSGDAAAYDLQREAEDIVAVIESIGAPVNVLGHSYGGLCAIEAARLTDKIQRLVLYEAVPLNGADTYAPGMIERFEAMLDAGEIEPMLVAVYRDLVQMPPREIVLLRSQQEAWAVRLSNVRTLPREMRSEASYRFEPERFTKVHSPTILLVGEDSPPREHDNAAGVAAALPNANVTVLPGQQHAAMHTAPELFVRVVALALGASH